MIGLFGITFGGWHVIFLLPFFLVPVVLLCWYALRRKRITLKLLVVSKYRKLLFPGFSLGRTRIQYCLFFIGFCFLFFALLQPQWNKKEETIMQEGRDLFIALDISRSMLAQDVLPSRLEWAKAKIKSLVHELKSERVGLILFAGDTFILCPLTMDHAAFYMFLDQIDADTISSGSTAIDRAISKALDGFAQIPDQKNKLLLLFTDGEDFSRNLYQVKKRAAKQGMHIFTIGVGTAQGAPIPLYDENKKQIGHQTDKKGTIIITRLNENILQQLSDDTGGIFVKATASTDDINTIIKMVQQFEKRQMDEKKVTSLEHQYPYFLLVSFICFALEWIL